MATDRGQIILITGFPLITAKRLALHISSQKRSYIAMLTPPKFEKEARSFVESNGLRSSVRVVVGDVSIMHLGFSSEEYRFLLKNVTDIYHLAAIYYPGTPDDVIRRVNIGGTKNIIQFASETEKNAPLNYLSTCMVFENHSGLVSEEPVRDPVFTHFINKSKYIAESLIMAEKSIPSRIFRAPMIGGDSVTGETERLDGFYALIYLLMLTDMKIPIPLPHQGRAPLNIVPIDYLVKVMYYISQRPESLRNIFHIVDPNPVSIRTALELVSRHSKTKMKIFYPPVDILKPLVRFRLLKRLIPAYLPLLEILSQFILFGHSNTDRFLKGSDIDAPQFERYIDSMLSYVRKRIERAAQERNEILFEDPLSQ